MEIRLITKVRKLRIVLSCTTVAELYSFMKCLHSCQFLQGLWMEISGVIANIHMRTDAKNLVTTARTIHLPEQIETGKLLDVDIHSDFRTPMEHKASLSTWCRTFMHTKEKEVFFLNTLKTSLAQTLQERPFQVTFVGTQQTREQKELNTRKCQGQDATKITSAPAESCIQFL